LVRDDRVECRDVFSDNVRWRWRADRGWDHSGQIERAGDRVYLSGGKRRELFAWLDLQNGTIAHILSRRHQRWETDNLSFPTLVAAHGATTMIGKTRDGVYATGLTSRPAPDEERGLSNLALNPHSSDPRRVRPVPALGRPVDAERFAAIPNSILLSLLGLILPLSYVWLPIRRRRCSLRWLMLAPAVVLLTLYAWRWLMIESDTPLLAVMQLLGGTVACLGLLGLAQIIANRRWRLLSGTVAAAAAATLAILYAVYLDHEGRYPHLRFYVAPSDAAVTFAVATVNFSCVVLAARLMAARLRGTHARRSTGSHARSPTTAAT
jgi:hypothetical protein